MSNAMKHLADLDAAFTENRAAVSRSVRPNTKFSVVTMFLLSALQRVESNADAIKLMVSSNNYPVACAILRMQIDTAMRVNGLKLMADPHDGVQSMLGGERYDRIRPKRGDKLRDAVLLKALDEDHRWIRKVYDRVSGMVHLSGMHIHHILDHRNSVTTPEGHLQIDFAISSTGPGVPDELFDEVSQAFVHITLIASGLALAYLKREDELLNGSR